MEFEIVLKRKDGKELKLNSEIQELLDKIVYLREDEQGRYVEYAFRDGEVPNKRCLSWYDKPHPNAWIKTAQAFANEYGISLREYCQTDTNEEYIENKKKLISKVGELYYLSSFTCGNDNNEGESCCQPGNPSMKCLKTGNCGDWSYDEPRKCACWYLTRIGLEGVWTGKVDIPLTDMIDFINTDK